MKNARWKQLHRLHRWGKPRKICCRISWEDDWFSKWSYWLMFLKSSLAYTSCMAKEEKSTGPPLPPNWVRVPHEGDHYYWNTQTNEASLTWTSWINLMFDLWSSWIFVQFPFGWTPCSVVVVCRSVGSIQSGSWFIFSHSLPFFRYTNHKAEQASKPKAEKKPKFTEEHKVLAAFV